MKQPGALTKVAAVASSVLLVGTLVSYQAGAFGWLKRGMPANEPERGSVVDEKMFYSSKSGTITSPDEIQWEYPADAFKPEPEMTIMKGSKAPTRPAIGSSNVITSNLSK
jgi:hypothetical protein